jgi:hypothetical protein
MLLLLLPQKKEQEDSAGYPSVSDEDLLQGRLIS